MSSYFWPLTLVCLVLVLLAGLALVPLLWVIDPRLTRRLFREPLLIAMVLGGLLGVGLVLGVVLSRYSDAVVLAGWGRILASLLHLILLGDVFVAAFVLVLRLWPKGGAVALAAFREGVRQPMYWLLFALALFLMALIPLLPYFTLGEDFKMVKDLGYETIVLFVTLFAILAAATSVSEEIEGRTAITLMSKPVSRREFLLGKFVGILLAAFSLAGLLGWFMIWMLLFMIWWTPPVPGVEPTPDPTWVTAAVRGYAPSGPPAYLLRGVGLWTHDAVELFPGQVIVSCQAMVLLAIATALATRLTLVVNVPVCLVIYILGHLAPVLTQVAAASRIKLVEFTAQVFDTVLPGLEHFHLGPAIVRDAPLDTGQFALYAGNVALYAMLYSAIALLFGLILFEDRDLA